MVYKKVPKPGHPGFVKVFCTNPLKIALIIPEFRNIQPCRDNEIVGKID